MKVSAAIITYNEEKNIARCIDSLINIVDEILIVDSFSTDKTVEISLAKGARVIKNIFKGHIEQKNFAVSQATHEYILSLDADEEISAELAQSIERVKNTLDYDAYEFNRLTNYCGKWIRHCGWYPDKKTRLFNRNKGKWGGSNPHDRFILHPNATLGYLKGDLLHYSYNSVEEHILQINYFTRIMAEEAVRKNKKSGIFFLFFSPLVKFIKSYFIQRGFLDGYYGWVICTLSSFATFIKYLKILELKRGN